MKSGDKKSGVKKSKRSVGRPTEKMGIDKEEILRIALKSFAEKGFGGVSLKSLAEKTGVAVSLLNYRFGNKEELWKKAMTLVGIKIAEEINDLFTVVDGIDGLEKLKFFNKKIVHTSAKHPEFQQIIVQEVFSNSSRSTWLVEELLRPIYSNMENLIAEEIEKGRIRNIPQAHITSFIIGSITTFFSRSYLMQKAYGIDSFSKEAVDAHAEYINELLFNGLLVKKE